MSRTLDTMRAPLTRVGWPANKTPAAFTVVGNVGKPADSAAVNVFPIPYVMRLVNEGKSGTQLPEVQAYWQMLFNTDSLTSDMLATIWAINHWTGDLHPWAKLNVVGDSLLSESRGRIWTDNGILGSTHIGVQTENHGGQELYVTAMWR